MKIAAWVAISSCGILAAADWPVYGGAGQTRYSNLKQINRTNVARLKAGERVNLFDTNTPAQMNKANPEIAEPK